MGRCIHTLGTILFVLKASLKEVRAGTAAGLDAVVEGAEVGWDLAGQHSEDKDEDRGKIEEMHGLMLQEICTQGDRVCSYPRERRTSGAVTGNAGTIYPRFRGAHPIYFGRELGIRVNVRLAPIADTRLLISSSEE